MFDCHLNMLLDSMMTLSFSIYKPKNLTKLLSNSEILTIYHNYFWRELFFKNIFLQILVFEYLFKKAVALRKSVWNFYSTFVQMKSLNARYYDHWLLWLWNKFAVDQDPSLKGHSYNVQDIKRTCYARSICAILLLVCIDLLNFISKSRRKYPQIH